MFEPFSNEELALMKFEEDKAASSSLSLLAASPTVQTKVLLPAAVITTDPAHAVVVHAHGSTSTRKVLTPQSHASIASALASHRAQAHNRPVHDEDDDGGFESDSDASTATPITSDDESDDDDDGIRGMRGSMNSTSRTCSTSDSILSLDSGRYSWGQCTADLSTWSVRVMVNEKCMLECASRRFSFTGSATENQFVVEVYAPDMPQSRWNLKKNFQEFTKFRNSLERTWPGNEQQPTPPITI
jgi:hypothetical protein